MVQFRVLLTDRAWPDFSIEREILKSVGAEIVEAENSDEATLIELARDVDGIGTCWAKVTDAVIRAAKNCRVIGRFGIGLDNISVATATELGIPVTYVPDYCVSEVADHTFALLLAAARKIAFYDHLTGAGRYDLQAGVPMQRLAGRTLGLIGFGRIGQAVFHRADGFGLDVVANTPSGDDRSTGCGMVSFDELLEISDFVSIHAPLSDTTRNLMNQQAFARMKTTAFVINTSRGPIINHADLYKAIQSGQIMGAALDVFDPEPPDLSLPLYQHERVIVTPHAAFLSEQSLTELRTRAATQIADVLAGRTPEYIVNGVSID